MPQPCNAQPPTNQCRRQMHHTAFGLTTASGVVHTAACVRAGKTQTMPSGLPAVQRHCCIGPACMCASKHLTTGTTH
jgi:hypothetical protein